MSPFRLNQLFRVLLLFVISVSLILGGQAGLAAADQTQIVARIPASEYAHFQTLKISPILDLDYGAFHWIILDSAAHQRLGEAGFAAQVVTDAYTLILGEHAFDPVAGVPDLPIGWQNRSTEGADLHLVQFVGPTRASWLDDLRFAGLEVVQYIHPFTYVVWGSSVQVDAAQNHAAVRWTDGFAPAYRVLPQWRNLHATELDVNALIYRGADADLVVQKLQDLGGSLRGRTVLNQTWELAGFSINGDQLQAAAAIPGVYSLQPVPTDGGLRGEMSNQINVNNHDGSNLAFPGYLTWLASVGLDGSGVIMANVDGGVQDSHTDLTNRMLPCTGDTCGGSAQSDHGTHTAGIMAADGTSGVVDSYGFLRGLGMAPGANLVEQVYSPWFTQPGGMLKLIRESAENNAVLSSNSWGPSGFPQGYDDDTMQVDIGVRDAQDDVAGNQNFTYVLSFMNGNGGTSSQGSPDEAKNIFTIGSTKMQNSNGSQILDINDLSSNTAHGPALDGRTIPHMVAPGCRVDSTVTGNGHGLMCGTSMSSPHVSGSVALFFEYYRNLFGVDPSPALVKAAFLPVAHDLAGNLDADGGTLGHPFDSKQGWGRMDAEAVLDPQLPVIYFDNPLIFDNTGETWEVTLIPVDTAEPMRLMLVWTDAPGHGLGGSTPAWNNDLDLVVSYAGDTYYGNYFDSNGWSDTGGSPDGMNNTEGVFLGPTVSGAVNVQVVASNINSNGIPNVGDDTDQDFSLVCYNCQAGDTGTLTGQVTDSVSGDPIENVQVGAQQTTATTDASGLYTLTLPAGTYDVTADHADYYSQTVSGVVIFTDTVTIQDFSLSLFPQAGVSIGPEESRLVGLPGEVVTYSFTVTNTGTHTDSFILSVVSVWTATLSLTETNPLPSGEQMAFTLAVEIPASAEFGGSNPAHLTAVSAFDQDVYMTVHPVTRAGWMRVYLPLATR